MELLIETKLYNWLNSTQKMPGTLELFSKFSYSPTKKNGGQKTAAVWNQKIRWVIYILLLILYFSGLPAQAKYSGGTGEPNDPYQIAKAEDLMLLGESTEDYDKHFILTADIDLNPNLPGRKVFDRAVIAPDDKDANWWFNGISFNGVFDGKGHTISNLTIIGLNYLGMFGQLGPGAEVRGLGVVNVNITGSINSVGGLIGNNDNSSVVECYSTGEVNGDRNVGGLIGFNLGDVTGCYSTSAVSGNSWIGGLIGDNSGNVTSCYSTSEVSGNSWIGGLLGINSGNVTYCYSTGTVSGSIFVGGFVGYSYNDVTTCFWDMETSGQSSSYSGTGKTTTEMQTSLTFNDWRVWNNQSNVVWTIDEGNDYPRLWWENAPGYAIEPTFATNPNPIDGVIHEDTWISLSWKAGGTAISHDVYFGDNFNNVEAGTSGTFQGNQTSTFYVVGAPGFAYPDGLVPGTTYYWRIDEVNDTDSNSPWKGPVWSFSIPPKIAYFPNPADGAESVDLVVELSWTAGFSASLHTVYFGENFNDVNNATGNFPQAITTYTPGPLEMAKTYSWRVDEFDGIDTHKGDVWSFITQGAVNSPEPANGAVDVKHTSILRWTPGIYADSHQVYFGTDKEAVKNADTTSPEYKGGGNLGSESYVPGRLSMNTTYYWRIDEFNNTNPDSPWRGPVWSFTIGNFIVVDDFESYNDLDLADRASNRIYLTWVDGFDNPTINGSIIDSFDIKDLPNPTTIVHSGVQSMWYSYDNAIGNSWATANIDNLAIGRDWVIEGVGILSLWFIGYSNNAAESMYVALANATDQTGVVYHHDNPYAVLIDGWTEWRIDLQEFADQGVDLTNVNSITIGFGNRNNPVAGGRGEMWFDDIRLYRPAL